MQRFATRMIWQSVDAFVDVQKITRRQGGMGERFLTFRKAVQAINWLGGLDRKDGSYLILALEVNTRNLPGNFLWKQNFVKSLTPLSVWMVRKLTPSRGRMGCWGGGSRPPKMPNDQLGLGYFNIIC